MKTTIFKMAALVLVAGFSMTACKKEATDQLVAKGFDIDLFNKNLQTALDGKLVGHSYAISKDGAVLRMHANGKARLAIDGEQEYTEETRQDIGSCAKYVTTLAVLKALDEKGLDEKAKIADFVPSTWNVAAANKSITFEQLLSHNSGLVKFGGEFDDLRKTMETPTTGTGTYLYNNVNFALCRVLLPYIVEGKSIETGFDTAFLVAKIFQNYIREEVFKPSGLTYWEMVDFKDWHHSGSRTYPFTRYYNYADQSLSGREGGSYLYESGAGGLFISAYELTQVLAAAEQGKIVPGDMMQKMKDKMMGFDGVVNGKYGNYIWKNGAWQEDDGRGMFSYVIHFPNNVQMTWFTNSRNNIAGSVLSVITTAYDNAWH